MSRLLLVGFCGVLLSVVSVLACTMNSGGQDFTRNTGQTRRSGTDYDDGNFRGNRFRFSGGGQGDLLRNRRSVKTTLTSDDGTNNYNSDKEVSKLSTDEFTRSESESDKGKNEIGKPPHKPPKGPNPNHEANKDGPHHGPEPEDDSDNSGRPSESQSYSWGKKKDQVKQVMKKDSKLSSNEKYNKSEKNTVGEEIKQKYGRTKRSVSDDIIKKESKKTKDKKEIIESEHSKEEQMDYKQETKNVMNVEKKNEKKETCSNTQSQDIEEKKEKEMPKKEEPECKKETEDCDCKNCCTEQKEQNENHYHEHNKCRKM